LYKQNGNANQQWRFGSPIVIPENTIKKNYSFYQWQGQGKERIGGVYFRVSDYNILNLIERYSIEIYGYDYEYPWGKPIKHEFISDGIIRVSTGGTYGTYGEPIRVWAIDKNGRYTLILDRFVQDGDAIIRIGENTRNNEQKLQDRNNIKLQLNFYNSTCNIYYYDDHDIKNK
ncbi:hypothetical protein, partial [Bacillus cereus]|uniref:hypothetical protein n=1 Tax=Bacillus cereus TaxID=1396 RepID=UPI0009C9D651